MIRHLSALTLLATSTLALAATPKISVRADHWMPFNGEPGDGAAPGYVIEVLNEVFGAAAIDYQNQSWETALASCRAGRIDGVLCANRKEAEGMVTGEECIAEVKYAVFARKSTEFAFTNYSSFKHHKIGAIPGYVYWDALDVIIAAGGANIVALTTSNPSDEGVTRLTAGEIEFYPEALAVFFWTAKKHGLPAGQFRMYAIQPGDPVFVAFRNDDQGRQWAATLDAGLRTLRKTGRLAAILSKYGLTDWK